MNVVLAFREVLDDFLEVFGHEVLVRNQLLSFFHFRDFFVLDVLLKDCHCITVVLAIEDNVESCLLVILERDLVWAFGEDLDLFEFLFFFIIDKYD